MWVLVGCGQTEYVGTKPRINHFQKTSDGQSMGEGIDNNQALQILQSIFKLQKPVVGLAQVKSYEVPAILPKSVQNPDIVFQFYRCESQSTIYGTYDEFDSENPQLDKEESAREYFARNDFWLSLSKQCTKVSDAQPQKEFLDLTTPSGSWRWYTRACIAGPSNQKFTCSPVISASEPLLGFKNKFDSLQQQLLAKIHDKMNSIKSLSISLPERGRELLSALKQCGEDDANNAERRLLRNNLLRLIGLGGSIALDIFGPTETASKSWKEKIQLIWQPTPDIQKNGQLTSQVLQWLFTQQHDFKSTCDAAEQIRIISSSDVLRLKALQIELASDLDDAERLGLPLPSEVK
jgi:hypothetical protein